MAARTEYFRKPRSNYKSLSGRWGDGAFAPEISNEELIRQYQSGDAASLESILLQNEGLVYRVSSQFFDRLPEMDRDDVVQIGRLALIRAARAFDHARNCKFSTLVVTCIKFSLCAEVKKANRLVDTERMLSGRALRRTKMRPLKLKRKESYCESAGENGEARVVRSQSIREDIAGRIDAEQESAWLTDWIQHLEWRDKFVMEQTLKGTALRDIGSELSITRSRAGQLRQDVVRLLSECTDIQTLRTSPIRGAEWRMVITSEHSDEWLAGRLRRRVGDIRSIRRSQAPEILSDVGELGIDDSVIAPKPVTRECPGCGEDDAHKHGFDRHGHPRLKCSNCGRTYHQPRCDARGPFARSRLAISKQIEVLNCLLAGQTLRSTARTTGVCVDTISTLIRSSGLRRLCRTCGSPLAGRNKIFFCSAGCQRWRNVSQPKTGLSCIEYVNSLPNDQRANPYPTPRTEAT